MDQERVYVIGHRNPDTDSICSAIAYAELKNRTTPNGHYHARRAGQINPETEFVLKRFHAKSPSYLIDVSTQVKDIEYRKVEGVSRDMSLRQAWKRMNDNMLVTLPIVNGKHLEGLITVSDITKAYMDIKDSSIITKANTSVKNIIETLEGELIAGVEDECLSHGKVLIAAANPDLMESYIEKGDIVILGNRYESQLCAIEMNAKCIIVCDGAPVSFTITKLADEHQCTIIKTPYDTYTVARLINQSMPVGYFMSSEGLITFSEEDFIDEIRDVMAKKRHRDFPILNKEKEFCGMVSRRNLLEAKRKKVILVDHNERSQAVDGLEEADILEIIDHHRLGSLETLEPVFFRNQPLGCTATIVYQMYKESQVEIDPKIAGLLCSAILSDTLAYRSPTCTEMDKAAAEELAKIAGIEDVIAYSNEMISAGSNIKDKSLEEIFYQDYKEFSVNDLTFGVGQIINPMSKEETAEFKEKLIAYMEEAFPKHKVNMLFFMLTELLGESTELLFFGEGAKEVVMEAFKQEPSEEHSIYLKNVVSRKKQLVPAMIMSLQKDQP